jgi:hypothetical protein
MWAEDKEEEGDSPQDNTSSEESDSASDSSSDGGDQSGDDDGVVELTEAVAPAPDSDDALDSIVAFPDDPDSPSGGNPLESDSD